MQMVVDAEHYDIVVEVNRSKVKLFTDFTYFTVGKTKSLLEVRATVVLAYCVLVSLAVVLDADSL
jgi:hypothetical protein